MRRLTGKRAARGLLAGIAALVTAIPLVGASPAAALAGDVTSAAASVTFDRPGEERTLSLHEVAALQKENRATSEVGAAPGEEELKATWNLWDCLLFWEKAGTEQGKWYGEAHMPNRTSTCRSSEGTYESYDPRQPSHTGTWKWRVIWVQNSARNNRSITQQMFFDRYQSSGYDDVVQDMLDDTLTWTLWCKGIEGSKCDDDSEDGKIDFSHTLQEWQKRSKEGQIIEATHGTEGDKWKPTDRVKAKARFPEIDRFYVDDQVSYHEVGATLHSPSATDPGHAVLRCDKAEYLSKNGGCVQRDAAAIAEAPYELAPEWARHINNALKTPKATFPYVQSPRAARPLADPYKWGTGNWFIPGGADNSNHPPLTRLYGGKKIDAIDPAGTAKTRYRDNRKIIRNTQKYLERPTTYQGKAKKHQADEFPWAATWEGAKYQEIYPTQQLKFSAKYIPGDQNNDGGKLTQRYYYYAHILAREEYKVRILDVPTDQAGHDKAVAAYNARKEAEQGRGVAAGALIPEEELCTSDILGGRFSCEYGEEWHQFGHGGWQVFAVGEDRQVWTTWTNADGSWTAWQSMGGQATSGVEVVEADGSTVTLCVMGTDGQPYYKERNVQGQWTEWHTA